ncbi:MAG: hypothetical protein MUF05_00950 [Candidatus Omnitrophica bacterium]|jgi:chromosome segregation ATPase|nr:hypothetical protein [Candidatus Omnitrophota bacterium]
MEQKVKIVILSLVALLLVCGFVLFQTFTANQLLEQEKEGLSVKNKDLTDRVNSLKKDYDTLESKYSSINSKLSKITDERDELKKRYEDLMQAREKLTSKIKELQESSASAPVTREQTQAPNDDYWAGVLRDKNAISMQLENLRSDSRDLKINNEQLQREKNALELEINSLNQEKQDLARQLEYAQKQIIYNKKVVDNIALELVGEKNDKLQINDSAKSLKTDNEVLRRQLQQLSTRKIDLEKKIKKLQDINLELEKKVKEMDILVKDKSVQSTNVAGAGFTVDGTEKVKENKENVELPPIIVRPSEAVGKQDPVFSKGLISPGGLGKIISVNKDNNFVLVDVGDNSGLAVGDKLHIYKNDQVVSVLEVIRLSKTIAACDMLNDSYTPQVGDIIRR